ncbi:molybdate ABC transporter substrate-binding protein [Azohydromonas lata]|uniref:Molybdate ABC transporter substrate-binding protein n=1 Tax=Azohydromonas lata TaxID=45677 RepID=A0ABU5IFU8_9BURK|nr:molybdate ABC transporter substrate-binding protein [Azohydromonas lata]MDZ5456828.1 molybdate ABC transporter substrate-binding protein [Azohydromonas lata]
MTQTCRQWIVRCAGALVALAAAASPALAQRLTVAMDDSLGDAMKAVALEFTASHGGVSVSFLAGASGALLEQLGHDTTADVLVVGDVQTLELGEQRRLLVPAVLNVFASNALVLVVPMSAGLPVQRLSDLARPEVMRIAMGRPTSVPAGRYAREAINAQRLWSSLQRKVVIVESVHEVLDLVASSDADAGLVFATDVAAAAGRVRVVQTLPLGTPIHHAAAVVAGSRNPALAREFVAYLRSEPARVVFRQFGFGVP